MKLICGKCNEIFHYGGYWHEDLGSPICYSCLGIEDEAEEASYRHDEEDYDDEEE